MGCCGSCCGSCLRCGGSRRKQGKGGQYNNGFQPGPPPPVPHVSQNQYHSPQQPMYQPSPYQGTKTATFDAPTKQQGAVGRYNEDSLPAMPSWADSKTKHVEDETVELERIHTAPEKQQQMQQPQPHVLSGYDETSSAAEHFNATPYAAVNGQPNYSQSNQAQPMYHAQSNYPLSNQAQPMYNDQSNYAQSNYAQSNYAQSNYAQSAAPYSLRSSQPESQYDGGQLEAQPHAYSTNAYTPTAYMPPMPNNDYNDPQHYAAAAITTPDASSSTLR